MMRNYKAAIFVLLTICQYFVKPDPETDCDIGPLDDDSRKQCQGLTGKKGFAMRCNNTGLTTVPSSYPVHKMPPGSTVCLPDLSDNKIVNLNDSAFLNNTNLNVTNILWLYLHNNTINRIEAEAFEGLLNLVYLNLSYNLVEWGNGTASGLFLPLRSLQYLNMKANNFTSFEGIDMELKHLRNLTSLLVNPMSSNYEFGPGFRNLTNLRNLSLSGMKSNTCKMDKVSNKTFEYLTQLKVLFMSDCSISEIDENSFKPLTNLVHLDISYNFVKFEGMNRALYGLRNSATLQTLKVHSLYKQEGLGIVLNESHFEHISTMRNITEIYMDINKIEIIDKNIFEKSLIPSTLRKFTLCGNRLASGEYANYLYLLKNITSLDLSRQFLVIDPFHREQDWKMHPASGIQSFSKRSVAEQDDFSTNIISVFFDSGKHGDPEISDVSKMNKILSLSCNCSKVIGHVICLPPNLQILIWQKSFLYLNIPRSFICNGENLTKIDLSHNLIQEWSGPVLGISAVKNLSMSDCNANRVYETFFLSFPYLENLDISQNILFRSFDIKLYENARKMFSTQRYLRSLDMSSNLIYTLPDDLFENTSNLERLYLRRNLFINFTVNLENTKIKHLDLSDNKISLLPSELLTFLDNSRKYRNVTLDFSFNKIDCSSCGTLYFLKWVKETNVNVIFNEGDGCYIGDKYFHFTYEDDINSIINNLTYNKLCVLWVKWVIIGGCVLLGCLLTTVIGVASYKNRWKLRYHYYNRRRYTHQGFEHIFSYDAYISYAKGKATFIYNTVAPKLEQQHGLRLWVADRNSTAGVSVAENIVYGIGNSRKTVLLVDDEYLEDSWCDYDMNMALIESIQTNRESIIIVLMTSCRINEIPVHILRALNQQQQIEYPDDDADLNTFWMNLASEINK